MTTAATTDTVRRLCQSAARLEYESATDGQLLRRFLDHRDEAAFAVLLRRHAAMVLGVCRRLLRNRHDADDAFQVTFFVLVRKAHSLTARQTVGDWLYGVAYHTALKTRAASVKRREKERHARRAADSVESAMESDLLPFLDRELSRLPEKYRTPIILCELEGKSRKDAAGLLGIPEGTLSSRMATAKKRLARRLSHLGLPATGAALTARLADAAIASTPPALLETTAEAAALLAGAGHLGLIPSKLILLTEGVMKSMLLTKLKLAAGAALVAGAVALTALGFTNRPVQADPPVVAAPDAKQDEPKKPTEPPKPVPPTPKIPADPPPQADPDNPVIPKSNTEVRGAVTSVDGSIAQTSLGKDHGVNKDMILEVFRLKPNSMYLGKLRITIAREHDSVGIFTPAMKGTIQKGDSVATKLDAAPKPMTPSPERVAITRKAIEAASALPTTDSKIITRKSQLLDFIARNQAKDGDRDGAAKTFQLAIDAAMSLKEESEQWFQLMQISSAQADAGLLAGALRTVDLIASKNPKLAGHVQRQKDTMRYWIVHSLAKSGKISEAKDLLETIKIAENDTTARDQALSQVAEAQIKQKDFAGATDSIYKIRSWHTRRFAYGHMVTALAQAGDRDTARKIIQILRKEMDRFRDSEPELTGWVHEVAQAQGMIGDVKEAQEWIDKLKSPELKAEAQFALLNGMAYASKLPRK